MDELVCVLLEALVPVVVDLRRPAPHAPAVLPGVMRAAVAHVALGHVKTHHRVPGVGVLGAVETATRQQAAELGGGDAKQLLLVDVLQTLVEVGDPALQACDQALRDLAQEDAALARGVKERGVRVLPDPVRQHVEHLVGHLGRSEHLVV